MPNAPSPRRTSLLHSRIQNRGVEDGLEKLLGQPLPASAQPSREYRGPTRLIVPTVRTSLRADESLKLKVIVPGKSPETEAVLRWRELGGKRFKQLPLWRVARGVYSVELSSEAIRGADIEYHVELTGGDGSKLVFPASAPALNQTVVVVPSG